MPRPLPPPLPPISTACAPASTFPLPLRPCLQPLSWPPHPTGASHSLVLSTAHTKSGHPSVQTPSMGLAHLVPKAFPPLDQPSSVLVTHTPLLPQFLTGQAHPPGLAPLSLLPSGLSQMPPPRSCFRTAPLGSPRPLSGLSVSFPGNVSGKGAGSWLKAGPRPHLMQTLSGNEPCMNQQNPERREKVSVPMALGILSAFSLSPVDIFNQK